MANKLCYRICYIKQPITVTDDLCDFGIFQVRSKDLAKNLDGCTDAVIYAATIGMEPDRLIAKYGRISPVKALYLQAFATERIESLCNAFCENLAADYRCGTKPRFSPGYGDLPLKLQCDICVALDSAKQIGVTLNDSLMLSPIKSVTGFIGLCNEMEATKTISCSACDKTDCAFRGVL